ncbi:MAG: ribosome small subunit-dependent GTPase A [Methanocella sp.]
MTFVDPWFKKLGWSAFFGEHFKEFAATCKPGRVSTVYKSNYKVHLKEGEVRARVSGNIRKSGTLPAVGDWVAVSRDTAGSFTIQAVLPRKSKFSRKDTGRVTGEQVIVTNIDTVFIMTSLNKDFNLRRLERYLAIAKDSGAEPVVVLSKSDVCDDTAQKIDEVREIVPDVNAFAISAVGGKGLEQLSPYLQEGKTVALIGSSGVGKSTLINVLAGRERQKVGEIREDDSRGRHVTTERELILLENGGIIIDNPGMRELQLWDAGKGLQDLFRDIDELARRCRFSDCKHETEPGCAIKAALRDGTLSEKRLESYRKLQKELAAVERKKNPELMIEDKKKWKQIAKTAKEINRSRVQGSNSRGFQ